ncbi:hypothetical protein H4219_001523 [Mycoemilia scoparia]|uniref:ERCC4 domain-containing protein n=1 Tax=Mycoemilia scoparia TaxID=417184 RepID=A0A9W7ZZZ5_9FUNG|nr:hypothetical protein H4219_001523 [Mycoemilia scoparia]
MGSKLDEGTDMPTSLSNDDSNNAVSDMESGYSDHDKVESPNISDHSSGTSNSPDNGILAMPTQKPTSLPCRASNSQLPLPPIPRPMVPKTDHVNHIIQRRLSSEKAHSSTRNRIVSKPNLTSSDGEASVVNLTSDSDDSIDSLPDLSNVLNDNDSQAYSIKDRGYLSGLSQESSILDEYSIINERDVLSEFDLDNETRWSALSQSHIEHQSAEKLVGTNLEGQKSHSQAITRREKDGQNKKGAQKKSKEEVMKAKKQQQLEREMLRLQKQKEKEQRRLEKEKEREIDKVNKRTVDKDLVVKDMMLYIDIRLIDPSYQCQGSIESPLEFSIEGRDIDTFDVDKYKSHPLLEQLSENEIPYRLKICPQKGSISWKRLIRAEWDPSRELFIPLSYPRWEVCPERLVTLKASEFAGYINDGSIFTFAEHITMRTGHPKKLFIVVQGLARYMQKQRMHTSRQFMNQVRDMMDSQEHEPPGSTEPPPAHEDESECSDDFSFVRNGPSKEKNKSSRRPPGNKKRQKKKSTPKTKNTGADPAITENQLEDALADLQVAYPNVYLLSPAASTSELAKIVIQTTQDVALAPGIIHRQQQLSRQLMLSIDTGQIRSGTDPKDTWIKTLSQIPRVTPLVAKSIAKVYPTLQSLYQTWCRPPQNDGLLVNIIVDRGQSIQFSKSIGAQLSKRIYQIFFGTEPEQAIGTT